MGAPVQFLADDEFQEFNSIPRIFRECVISEKIDGTNAQIFISDDLQTFRAGSRGRWITPEDDNYGFAKWAEKNREELVTGLGPGRHYGEWWGPGIQRGYGVKEKTFSLFNSERWSDPTVRPACCQVVPVLWTGMFDSNVVKEVAQNLDEKGSVASPGFMRPEGVVVFLKQSRLLFKYTLDGDGHKSAKK